MLQHKVRLQLRWWLTRCLCRYFADLVIGYMQQVLADMLLEGTQPAAPAQMLPPPLFSGNEVQGTAVCLKGEDLKGAVVKSKVGAQ